MLPIVHGLETEFANEVQFVYLNAEDGGEGQATFRELSLPGHPSYLLFASDGTEQYRAFGVVTDEALRAVLNASVNSEIGTSSP
jgi:hypothetical protein